MNISFFFLFFFSISLNFSQIFLNFSLLFSLFCCAVWDYYINKSIRFKREYILHCSRYRSRSRSRRLLTMFIALKNSLIFIMELMLLLGMITGAGRARHCESNCSASDNERRDNNERGDNNETATQGRTTTTTTTRGTKQRAMMQTTRNARNGSGHKWNKVKSFVYVAEN